MTQAALLAGSIWFAAACLFWCLSRTRIRADKAEMQPIPSRAEAAVDELLRIASGLRPARRPRLWLEQSGAGWTLAACIHVSALLFFLAMAAASFPLPAERVWLAAFPSLAAAALPWIAVARRRKARLRRFESQFADALEFASRALRAGHGLSAAIDMAANGYADPLGGEFRRVCEDLRAGTPTEASFSALAARVPVPDMEFFVAAVTVHERTGGSLGEVLRNLAETLRSRYKLRARARAATGHGRITGAAVSLIPVASAAAMYTINPKHLLFFLHDPAGRIMFAAVIGLQAAGYVLIRRVVVVR